MLRVRGLSCLWLAIAASPAVAQPALPPPVQLEGRVVAAGNGAPLQHVRVAGGGSQGVEPVLTDAQGQFVLSLPGPGYSITLTKAGYAALTLAAGPELRPGLVLEARLSPGAVITGRVIDAFGLPAPLVPVQAQRTSPPPDNAAIRFGAETDDHGYFRLGGLPEGVYVVTAGPLPSIRPGFVVTGVNGDANVMVGVPAGAVSPARALVPAPPVSGRRQLTMTALAGQETSGADFVLESSSDRVGRPVPWDSGGALRGRVLGAAGGLAGAEVTLHVSHPIAVASVFTADDGTYEFANLPPGDYRVRAVRPGYVALEYGQRLPAEQPSQVTVTAESPVDGVDITLPAGSAIAGTILDENGEPLEGVPIWAMQLQPVSGRTAAVAVGRARLSDDRGQFRLFGLPPGDYIVGTTAGATIYAPGSTDIEDAQVFRLGVAEEAAGVELVFTAAPAVEITGTVSRSGGEPAKGLVRLLRSPRSTRIAPEARTVAIDSDGRFRFANVTRGQYVVQARAEPGPGVPLEFAAEFVTVGERPPAPVAIRTGPSATLSGRVIVDGDAARRPDSAGYTPLNGLALRLIPADPARSPASAAAANLAVQSDGAFYITQLWGAGRIVLMSAPEGWYLRSVSLGGVDLAAGEFDFGYAGSSFEDAEMVLSRDGATVTGKATTAQGEPATGSSVIVFAADPRDWITRSQYIKYTRAAADGGFQITGLAPGRYFAAAVDRLDVPAAAADWDPDALERLAERASRITLREGETVPLTLRVTGG